MSLQGLLESKLSPRGRSGKDIIYLCPECNDRSGHLYVNYEKGYFHCFRCDFGGRSLNKLLRRLGLRPDFDYESLKTDYENSLDEILSMPSKQVLGSSRTETKRDYSYDINVSTRWFLEHAKPLSPPALQYLLDRGLTLEQINFYGIMEGVNRYKQPISISGKIYYGKNYSGRILIPSIIPNVGISFFVARDYLGTQTIKYLNPPKEIAYASEDVWNLKRVQSRAVIVCEGVFTAITAGGMKFNATATYGKSIAEVSNAVSVPVKSQGEKLLEAGFDVYYMSYDSDATEESLENARYLHERGAKVKIVYINPDIYGPKADANSIGYQEYLKCLASAYDYEEFLHVFLK